MEESTIGFELLGHDQLVAKKTLIESWLFRTLEENPLLLTVELDTETEIGEFRWFARVVGEEKDTFTLRFTLRQRMLHYETYVMPEPEENYEQFFRHLLVRNRQMVGATFCIGEEGAIFLIGSIPSAFVTEGELDRIFGTLWTAVESYFQLALQVGIASRFNK